MSNPNTIPEVFAFALAYSRDQYPDHSEQRHHAFANGVTYLVTGVSQGSKGPSIREHLVSYSLAGVHGKIVPPPQKGYTLIFPDGSLPPAGNWELKAALAHCIPIVHGDLNIEKARLVLQNEYIFDDDPADLILIQRFQED